jgi:Hint domain
VTDISSAVAAGETLAFTDATGLLRLHQPASVAATIVGFVQGDTIDLAGITASTAVWSANKLTISSGSATVAILTMPGNYTQTTFVAASDKAGGSQVTITATCFGAGTHILTTRGDIAVERLCGQDFVVTASGVMQPIVWIGQRHVDFRRHSNKLRVLPVHVAANAFGPELPKRTLLLSPDHAVYVDDVLIPIRFLINDTSIVQMECDAITYYHVELPRHDVLLAEGLPTESYLDAGARRAFANCDGTIQLNPEFAPPQDDHGALWDAKGYAPLIVTGELLERVRRRLDANARVWRRAA